MDSWLLAHSSLAFFALAMMIISVWVKNSPWIWGAFFIFAFILGYFAKLVSPIALAPIGGLCVIHALLKGDLKGLARFILVGLATTISIGLLFHLFPGFRVWQVVVPPPQSIFLSFSKPFIGIFVLALGFPLLKNPQEFRRMLRVALPMTIVGIAILMMLALFSAQGSWNPKFPKVFWFFALSNLIFVSIIEEAFWRGFIQKELFRWFGERGFLANTGCVLCTALGFAAMNYWWTPNIAFLGFLFVTGIVYGSIYQSTKSLEASILCHWLFNLTYFLLLR